MHLLTILNLQKSKFVTSKIKSDVGPINFGFEFENQTIHFVLKVFCKNNIINNRLNRKKKI